jgi:Nuclease-related domain
MDVRESSMRDRIAGELLMLKVVTNHLQRTQQPKLARFFGVPPLHADDLSWFTGALGERVVAQTLSGLPGGWYAFHSLPIGSDDSDIDHVVVGPAGIFTINTKHHRGKKIWVGGGTFMVNGQRHSYIRNAEHEAARLTRVVRGKLPVAPAVRPIIAVVGSESITVKSAPRDVHIDGGRTVLRWLKKQRAILSPDAVEQIAALLDDPTTWRLVEPLNREVLSSRFDQLVNEVERARSIQTAWKVGGVLVLVVGFIWMLSSLT